MFDFTSGKDNGVDSGGSTKIFSISGLKPRRRLTEQVFGNLDAGTEFDDALFLNMTQGAVVDIAPEQLRKAQRISLLLHRSNVRAYAAIELVKDFVIGDGIEFEAVDPKVQTVLREHWERNEWDDRLEERVRSLAIFGEQLFPIIVEPESGLVRLSSITPFRLIKVNRNSDNAEILESATVTLRERVIQSASLGEDSEGLDLYRLIGEGMPDQADIPLRGALRIKGDAFYFPINRVAGATRGVPDLSSSLDWLSGLDSLVFSMLERAELTQNVVFDLTCKNLGEKELRVEAAKFLNNLRAGGAFAHNQNTTLEIKTPKLGSSDAETMVSIMLRQVQAGTRLAGLFFGDSADLTRASASELSIPVAKFIQGRQNFIRRMIEKIFNFQIGSSRNAGRLDGVTDFSFKISMARVYLRDVNMITKSIKDISGSLETATKNEWITKEEATVIFKGSLDQLGFKL